MLYRFGRSLWKQVHNLSNLNMKTLMTRTDKTYIANVIIVLKLTVLHLVVLTLNFFPGDTWKLNLLWEITTNCFLLVYAPVMTKRCKVWSNLSWIIYFFDIFIKFRAEWNSKKTLLTRIGVQGYLWDGHLFKSSCSVFTKPA